MHIIKQSDLNNCISCIKNGEQKKGRGAKPLYNLLPGAALGGIAGLLETRRK
jgi:hypothetical protein